MIEAIVEFAPGLLESVVRALLTLPVELRPSYCSLGEDSGGVPVNDFESYLEAAKDESLGPFFRSVNSTFDVSAPPQRSVICSAFLSISPDLAQSFLVHMAKANPLFGLACAPEERASRNRITTVLGVNTVDTWVGRDLRKYLPGLYWITLISQQLADEHHVPLAALMGAAREHAQTVQGQHLFRFYDRPEDWQVTTDLTDLCVALPGVFDIGEVRSKVAWARNLSELNSVLRNWK